MNEKHDFVQAVLCLSNKPSRWGPNGTMYDDFALLHGEIGSWSTTFASASHPIVVECVSHNYHRSSISVIPTVASLHTPSVGNKSKKSL